MAENSSEITEQIAIVPAGKRYGFSYTLAGAIGLLVAFILFIQMPTLFAVGVTIFGLSLVALVLGIAKLLQPQYSLLLQPQGLIYQHRRGRLLIRWQDIQRIDQLRADINGEWQDLPFIGIKLKRLDFMLDHISPRLASGLLTEQRPLMMSAVTMLDSQINLEEYVTKEFESLLVDERVYKGLLAMFGHRCQLLAQQLGFHLYVPIDVLDRTPEQFIQLLRQYSAQNMQIKS